MTILNVFLTYIHYLIHPFQTHEQLLASGEQPSIQRLNAYESLTTSWVFVIINGMARILLLNMVLVMIAGFFEDSNLEMMGLFDLEDMSSYSFLVLSAVLDIIFYPFFGLFIIQYWEVVIKFFARLIHTQGDIAQKANDIVSVYFASNILRIIPFFGAIAQSMAAIVLMYAGLRVQLKASPALSFCIIFSPIVLMMIIGSVFMLMVMMLTAAV